MSLKKRTLADLTYFDFGSRITIYHGDMTIAGPLQGIAIEQQMVDDTMLCDPEPRRIAGQSQARVLVGGWSSPPMPLDTTVRVEGEYPA